MVAIHISIQTHFERSRSKSINNINNYYANTRTHPARLKRQNRNTTGTHAIQDSSSCTKERIEKVLPVLTPSHIVKPSERLVPSSIKAHQCIVTVCRHVCRTCVQASVLTSRIVRKGSRIRTDEEPMQDPVYQNADV
jgi:hypothetical protein